MRELSAPAVPSWMMAEKEAAMQVDDEILNCTVFLGQPAAHGFTAFGTGFFLHLSIEEMSFLYIVTCRHVVRPTKSVRDSTPNDDPIWIRINREGGKAPKTIKTKRSDWLYHVGRRIDVCLYPFDVAEHNADNDLEMTTLNVGDEANLVLTAKLEERWGLALGDEVFIVGCFVGRVGDQKNIPVIRLGSIAAKPDEPVGAVSHQRPAYLIETRSLGGVSGSPVFLPTDPSRRRPKPLLVPAADGKSKHAPYFLIGMMIGVHSGQYADDFVGEDADDDEQKVVPADTDFNAGIGVAIPIGQVMDLVNRPDLVEARMATIAARKKQTGYHDASAESKISEPALDDDANPNHQADFKRLVDVAARKRPQGDQT